MWSVLYADVSADLKGLIDPFQHALACHIQGARDLAYGLADRIEPQNLCPLDVAERSGFGLAKLIDAPSLLVGEDEFGRVDTRAMPQRSMKQEQMDMS